MLKPGDTIDSWCGKCKRILAHTIEALIGDKPARVHCNTCKAAHAYRPNEPGTASSARKVAADGSVVPPVRKPRASRHQTLLKGKDMATARRYSPQESYALGDVVEHPTFGIGVTIALRDGTKVEVLFDGGPKVLVQGR
jgi:hypothetical protein